MTVLTEWENRSLSNNVWLHLEVTGLWVPRRLGPHDQRCWSCLSWLSQLLRQLLNFQGLPSWPSGKESACNAGYAAGAMSSIPGSGRVLEKEMATHSSIFAWEIPWAEESGGLLSVRSQRVGHNLVTKQQQAVYESLLKLYDRYVCYDSRSVMSDSVTPWTVACQAPLSMEFSRQEHWSGWPFPPPRDLPGPGTQPGSPAQQADSFQSVPPGKPPGKLHDLNLQFNKSHLKWSYKYSTHHLLMIALAIISVFLRYLHQLHLSGGKGKQQLCYRAFIFSQLLVQWCRVSSLKSVKVGVFNTVDICKHNKSVFSLSQGWLLHISQCTPGLNQHMHLHCLGRTQLLLSDRRA